MQVLRDLDACPRPPGGTAVTIGAYDGVHVGHRAVIAEVRRRAEARGLASAVVTFDRHPASVVRPESAPRLLTDLDQKLELLAATGVDYTLVVAFDEARSKERAEDFVAEVLVGCLGARLVVVGADFHFGHERKGNVELLAREGARHGFEVEGVELVTDDLAGDGAGSRGEGPGGEVSSPGRKVSSTAIRHALVEGRLGDATRMLGRLYEVRGVVAEGDRRGRELGFPTANVSVPGDVLLPADGIYAGWFERDDGAVLPTAINLGRRPTFYAEAHVSLLEAHVLDFAGDLYGERVKVRFVQRLRPEVRFDSVDDLVEQMARDCDEARAVLGA